MRVGDIDGKDVVYTVIVQDDPSGISKNYAGDLLLQEDEKLSAVFPDSMIGLSSGLRKKGVHLFPAQENRYGQFYAFEGNGSLYITNKRIVFLRRPEIASLRRAYGSDNYQGPALRVAPILNARSLEYCVVDFEDLSVVKSSMTGSSIRIVARGQKFILNIGKEETKVLKETLARRKAPRPP